MFLRCRSSWQLSLIVLLLLATSCANSRSDTIRRKFPMPPADLMPRRVMVAKHSEIDVDGNGYIDGVLVTVYYFNPDRPPPGSEQPFHRDGTLKFQLVGPQGEVLCEGQFSPEIMAKSRSDQAFGPGYPIQIQFGSRGYADVRERVGARLDFEFLPKADPERRSFGSTQIRLGPMF
ncbi:MAG: hypothetical protein KIT54_04130 [Phycisphaeraceae bacterium]|nr:hypothetical protein [Phycisphaeraceae bacterium]